MGIGRVDSVAGSRSTRWRRGQVALLAALITVATVGLVWYGDGQDQWVEHLMRRNLIPALATDAGFDAIPDWSEGLADPPEEVRRFFARYGRRGHVSESTYRVIEAEPDRALLALWVTEVMTDERNPYPVGRGRLCARIEREGASGEIVAEEVRCPARLAEYPGYLREDALSWGRDSQAVENARHAVHRVDAEVRWLVTKRPDGAVRDVGAHDDPSVVDVLRVIRDMEADDGVRRQVLVREASRTSLVAVIVARATGTDPVDTREVSDGVACGLLDVDPTDRHPNVILTPVECPEAVG